MDVAPRSSKRRRLNDARQQSDKDNSTLTSAKSANGTLKRPTRQRTPRHVASLLYPSDDPLNEHNAVTIKVSPVKSIKSSARKTTTAGVVKRDVYEDFDEALMDGSIAQSGRRKSRRDERDDLDSGSEQERLVTLRKSPAKKNLTARLRAVSGKTDRTKALFEDRGQLVEEHGNDIESSDERGGISSIKVDAAGSQRQSRHAITPTKRSKKGDTFNLEDDAFSRVSGSGGRVGSQSQRQSRSSSSAHALVTSDLTGEVQLEEQGISVSTRKRKPSRRVQESGPDALGSPALSQQISRPFAALEVTNGYPADSVIRTNGARAPPEVNRHMAYTQAEFDEMNMLKSIVLSKLMQKRPIPLHGLDEEYGKVFQLMEQTIAAGEGNSMLVIGARGSGKSTLVNNVLAELSQKHGGDFHVVRLNGFIQTDDKLALREIWRQLGKEMDFGEDGVTKNYADTLTTLLALLSHPSDAAGQESDQIAKAVVFIMDEFDLFATHPRQTLLYNLFDIAQSRKAPIAVLGLTTRIDAVESLEKRVKSRFSHRYVHISLAKEFGPFRDICKGALMIQPTELSEDEKIKLIKTKKLARISWADGFSLDSWNASIEKLFDDPDFTKTVLAAHYHRSKSIPAVLTSAFLPVLSIATLSEALNTAAFQVRTANLQPPDSKLYLLAALSDIQLGLLIAAARLDVILDADTCNFNMAYAEYISLTSRARIQSAAGGAIAAGAGTKVWGKEVARGEWESLIELELLMPVAGSAGGANAMVRVDVALEEIAPSVPGLDRLLHKWCQTI